MGKAMGGHQSGSPATAGMDPSRSHARSARRGLPRDRGDGPHDEGWIARFLEAPPRPREWTRVGHPEVARRLGSPAPAGMDRRSAGRAAGLRRLPRDRGDGPGEQHERKPHRAAPPRPRGWTLVCHRQQRNAPGSPATAGMDLPPIASCLTAAWLPRDRGDGPKKAKAQGWTRKAPPRPLGWTLCRGGGTGPRVGSPATAGMDLAPGPSPW